MKLNNGNIKANRCLYAQQLHCTLEAIVSISGALALFIAWTKLSIARIQYQAEQQGRDDSRIKTMKLSLTRQALYSNTKVNKKYLKKEEEIKCKAPSCIISTFGRYLSNQN